MASTSAIKATESQERYGEHYADGYDDRRFTTTEGSFAQAFELDLFRRTLRRYGARRVLDMPIGTGRVAIPLANEFEFVGGDISPAMIAEGKARAERAASTTSRGWSAASTRCRFPTGTSTPWSQPACSSTSRRTWATRSSASCRGW